MNPGGVITYRIEVFNFGPDMAKNVYIQQIVPAFLLDLTTRDAYYNGDYSGWYVGDLPYCAECAMVFTATVSSSEGFTVQASAFTETADEVVGNNGASCSFIVEGSVDSVTVSPAAVTAKRGESIQFAAKVGITGEASSAVRWSVDSVSSTIDENGVLTLLPEEPMERLTVTATAVGDMGKSVSAVVTVVQSPLPGTGDGGWLLWGMAGLAALLGVLLLLRQRVAG